MSTTILDGLGVRLPVVAAPMAGGPTTPALVVAAARAGSIGFLAGGYRTPELLDEQIAAVRSATGTFGVNLFAPNPVRVEAAAYRRYRDAVRGDAARFGVAVPPEPVEDDDHWRDKVDVLLAHPVPIVSFTFGLPDAGVVSALHRAGSLLVQTVTSADEALRAVDTGVDALVVQGSAAGGHSGTLTPDRIPPGTPLRELLAEVNHAVGLPKIAAGGVVDPTEVAAMITCCAMAVMVGTALLLAPEAGTSAAHRTALLGGDRGDTIVTRSFTGRPARALPNRFTAAHHDHAPSGYSAVHHLTGPMRRAAAAVGDPEHVNLWAGTGYRRVREQPAAETLTTLARDL